MAKPELGTKRDCPECAARFYDLNKDPAHCPKCGNEFSPEALLKPRRPRKEAEEDEPEAAVEAKPEKETDLKAADKEKQAPKSARKKALDDDSEEEDDDELGEFEDIDIDDDDDADDDALLDDDEDDDSVSSIVSSGDDDDK